MLGYPLTPPPHARMHLINTVRGFLQQGWSLPVVCGYVDNHPHCTGHCCTPLTKIIGYVLVREPTGKGLAFMEPFALTATWRLCLGPTLLAPDAAHKGYLGSIFTRMLKNGIRWTRSWITDIFSAAPWLQVALLSGYRREPVMRAMHKGLRRAHVTSEHDTRATIKAVYSLSYHMLAPPCEVALRLEIWLWKNAFGDGNQYASWWLPAEYMVQGITGDWCNDLGCLAVIKE